MLPYRSKSESPIFLLIVKIDLVTSLSYVKNKFISSLPQFYENGKTLLFLLNKIYDVFIRTQSKIYAHSFRLNVVRVKLKVRRLFLLLAFCVFLI